MARCVPPRQHNDPSRLASQHLSRSASAVAIAGRIAVIVECLDLKGRELFEPRRGGGHLGRAQERDIDFERDTRGATVYCTEQGWLAPDALDGGRHIGREGLARAEERWPGLRRSTGATREGQENGGDGE